MPHLHEDCTLTPEEGLSHIWNYVRLSERKVLDRIVDDARQGLVLQKSQWPSWKSGKDGINANNYGVLRAFRPMARRHEHAAALDMIARNIVDYCACFRANGNVPPGEAGKIENGRYLDWDGDRRRHTDLAGFCDCLQDFEIQDRLSERERNEARNVAWDYYRWIIANGDLSWFLKSRREVLRFPLLLNSLCAISQLFAATHPEVLLYAKQLFWWGWGPSTESRVSIGDGQSWTCFDTGWPWEEEHILGHATDWTWYIGQCAEPFLRLYLLCPDDPVIRGRLTYVLAQHCSWFHPEHRTAGPRGDLHRPGDRAFVNAKLHGQMHGQVVTPILGLAQPNAQWAYLSPRDFVRLAWNVPYMRSITTEWSEPRDGGYLDERLISRDGVDVGRRRHHQEGGCHFIAGGDGYSWPELFSVYAAAVGISEYELVAVQGMFDYLGFANRSGIWRPYNGAEMHDARPGSHLTWVGRPDGWLDGELEVDDVDIEEAGGPILYRKDQANTEWYSGAQGVSRGMSWMLQCNRIGRDRVLGGNELTRL